MATQHVTSKDGTRIAYETLGSGPPLVLVSGALGSRAIAFSKPMREELAKSFTVYDYDRRGRGESGDTKPYSPQREIEDLRAVCEAAGGNPYVVGFSSGAALALEAAAAGVPMRALAAQEPPYVDDVDRSYTANVTALVEKGDRDGAVRLFMRTVGVPAPMLFFMRLMPFWKTAVANAHTLPYDAQCMSGFEAPATRLAQIRVPTVVLWGTKTSPSLQKAAKDVARIVPGARDVALQKQGHGVKPAALRPVLVETFGAGQPAG